ncbi:hypothetical protein FACS1894206_03550 [Deltaproteobacteria bacterium]|nr:hypothetical protein FACS1894206_03550 [Deltaproteobacteria bacterium]
MLKKSLDLIKDYLRCRGFTSPEARRIMASQILLSALSLLIGGCGIVWSLWPLAFGIGATLATINLWWIARAAHWSVRQRFGTALVVIYFGAFLLRFAGTGLVFYLLLRHAHFPPVPLIVGLFSSLACLWIMGFSRKANDSCKEAQP